MSVKAHPIPRMLNGNASGRAHPRWRAVKHWGQWKAFQPGEGFGLDRRFNTHAEAFAYADQMARRGLPY